MLIRTKPKQKRAGIVYCLKGGDYYKIGVTTSIPRRLAQLAPQCPFNLTCAHVIRTDDMYAVENYWHRRFSGKRLNGEWFALDAKDIEEFSRLRVATIARTGRIESLDQTTLQLLTEQNSNPDKTERKRKMTLDLSKHLGNSGYLKAADIDATDDEEMVLVIAGVEEVYSQSLKKEQIEVSFDDEDGEPFEKKLTLNVTNTKKLVELFGLDDEDWIGKKIKLYSDDSRTPDGAPCRTIKIKAIKKKAEPEKELVGAGAGAAVKQGAATARATARQKAKAEDDNADPFADE